jgi:hypothetical protein
VLFLNILLRWLSSPQRFLYQQQSNKSLVPQLLNLNNVSISNKIWLSLKCKFKFAWMRK